MHRFLVLSLSSHMRNINLVFFYRSKLTTKAQTFFCCCAVTWENIPENLLPMFLLFVLLREWEASIKLIIFWQRSRHLFSFCLLLIFVVSSLGDVIIKGEHEFINSCIDNDCQKPGGLRMRMKHNRLQMLTDSDEELSKLVSLAAFLFSWTGM